MTPKLSIIVPGIRVNNWEEMYNSICASTSRPFELILVSPYDLPPSLQSKANIKHIKDFGSPVRCSNIGLEVAEGELLTWNADDGTFLPEMIDKAIDSFEAMPPHPKNVLITKYMEGERKLQPDDYFKLRQAYPPVQAAHPDWWIFNLVITSTKYFKALGGWDCQFETLAFSHADLAIRAQRDGCPIKVFEAPIVFNTHGHADHVPVERAHVDHDDPLYRQIHNDPSNDNRIVIPLDNWRKAESVWRRRFPS